MMTEKRSCIGHDKKHGFCLYQDGGTGFGCLNIIYCSYGTRRNHEEHLSSTSTSHGAKRCRRS